MSSNVYFIEWTGKYTGTNYRLEVIPSGEVITQPNYVRLPQSAIEVGELEWSYQDVPLGISGDCRCKVTWNLDEIQDTYLLSKLFYPITQHTLPTNVDYVTFEAGNVYTFYANNTVFYRGVQVSDEAVAFDGSYRYEVELTGLGKYVLSCFDLRGFVLNESHQYRLNEKISPVIFEYYDKYNYSSIRTIISAQSTSFGSNVKDKFYFWSVQSFETWLRNAFRTCAAKILRRSTAGFIYNFNLPIADYYKQDYQGNQNIGAKLTKSELMILTYVYNAKKNMAIGGLFSQAQDSLVSKYSTWWDFLSDLAISEGMKLFVDPIGTLVSPQPMFNSNPQSFVLNGNIDELKELRRFNIKQITVSLEEFGEDDVDNYRYSSVSRNENELQIPLLFNTTPPVNDYKNTKDDYCGAIGQDFQSYFFTNYISKDPCRVWNYYYFDQPIGMTTERSFRVHDFCSVAARIRDNIVTGGFGTYPSVSSVPYNTINDPKRYCLAVQREHAKPSMFKGLLSYLGHPGTCKLKVGIATDTPQVFIRKSGWLFKFYPATINQHATNFPEDYYLTKVKFDFDKETVEMELFGVGI